MAQTTGAKFQILSDAEKKAINAYGIVNAEEHGGIAKPATFLIDKDGKIRFLYVGKTGADRPDDALTLSEVEKLTKR
jgi:peroxiredoxin